MGNSNIYEVGKRDIIEQRDYYAMHVDRMTGEKLHDKTDIAAELAHRDIQIDNLTKQLPQWIPVSERPPEVGEMVLISSKDSSFVGCLTAQQEHVYGGVRWWKKPGQPGAYNPQIFTHWLDGVPALPDSEVTG